MRSGISRYKLCGLIHVFFFCLVHTYAQNAHTVWPIGNLGDVSSMASFASQLRALQDSVGGNQTIVFTGDITNAKFNLQQATARLDTLLSILSAHPDRRIVFIPGDRDWADSGMLGWEQVNLLEEYINSLDRQDVLWPLQNGCPGPEKVELDLALHLIVINTQWWNHPYQKPTPESAVCEIASHDEAIEELEKYIEETRFGNVLIAGHYPVISGGSYGGHYPLVNWVFPVPVVSTMMTAHKQNVGSSREICNERYSEFREDMEDILQEYPSLIYVSGHDPHREIIQFKENILVQSGAPSEGGYLARSAGSIYDSRTPGLIALHYDMEGNVWATTYDRQENGFDFTARKPLLQAPCVTPLKDVNINQRLVPCLTDQYVLPRMESIPPEDTYVAANPEFKAKGFKKLMLGEHYRKSWITPVEVSYLNLDSFANGLVPYLEGGGRQTKTLRFTAEDGREYVFRSVDKDPSKALSYNLRESLISLVVRDQITTQHPYGTLATSYLLEKVKILHPSPRLYLMPNDAKLGPFRETFGDMLGMIEERPSGRKEMVNTFADADEILGSTEMFRELYKDGDNSINTEEFAHARMFDILTGDWSKHEDNWRWAGYKQDRDFLYRPVPRDRDHVFSKWDGVLPWLIDREWAKPAGENFDYRIKGMRSLTWQARHLDRFVCNELTRDDWKNAAQYIQAHLTDADFDTAVTFLPKEVKEFNDEEIAGKLSQRLIDLEEYANEYYEMLARQVDVPGSNKTEQFDIVRNADGTVDVAMFKVRQGMKDKQIYYRRFYPDETQEVRLYGLHGDDVFSLKGNTQSSIPIRIIPGPGINTITDSSHVQRGKKATIIYSLYQTDRITADEETRIAHIPFQDAYRYRRTSFTYNIYMPVLYLWSSSGNGLVLNGGITFTRQAYDKPDFSAIHRLAASISTLGNLRFVYDGTLRHVLGTWDLTYGLLLDKHRRLNYFFGTGNNTTLDPDLLLDDYYTLQYSSLQVKGGLTRTFWNRSNVSIGLILKGTGRENISGNIFEPGVYPEVAGLERLRIIKGYLSCDVDFRDRIHLPQRGMRLQVENIAAAALNDEATNYLAAKGSIEYFGTVKPFTLGLKVGGAVHDGVTPFFDLQYLGQNTDLRGYRQNRFTGKSLVFVNTDLRIQLVDNPRALIPYKLGVTLFYDMGRVFGEEEPVDDAGWHMGYGAGIYFVPLRERFTLQVSMGFSEEESGLFRFGFGQAF